MAPDSTSASTPSSSAHPTSLDKPKELQPESSPPSAPAQLPQQQQQPTSSSSTAAAATTETSTAAPPQPSPSPSPTPTTTTSIPLPQQQQPPAPTPVAVPTPSVAPTKPATPSRGGRARCTFKTCTKAPQRIVGDCSFCAGHFCGRHRMLEDHACAGLETCKEQARERNKDRLEGERTVVVRGI